MGSRPARSVLPVARRSTTAALALVCAIAAATAPAQEPLDDVARAIRAIIDAAWHPDLRWPRFPDYRERDGAGLSAQRAAAVVAARRRTERAGGVAQRVDPHNRRVDLDQPVPIYLLYSTAVVSQGGDVLFFEDIYDCDEQLARLLAGGYPYPGPAR